MVSVAQWCSRPPRLRRRRRLLLLSTPAALIVLIVIAKLVSAVAAGNAAAAGYAERDRGALRTAVGTLTVLNVVDPGKTSFAAGALAVLDNRLPDADRQFTDSLSRTAAAESCPVRVNLELVRETMADRAVAAFDGRTALSQYLSARAVVEQAPQGCFAGNTDPDLRRQALRRDTVPRLDAKINAARIPPPPPPPPPPPAEAAPPPPPSRSAPTTGEPDPSLRLNPGGGAPLDRLQQILRDAAKRRGP